MSEMEDGSMPGLKVLGLNPNVSRLPGVLERLSYLVIYSMEHLLNDLMVGIIIQFVMISF